MSNFKPFYHPQRLQKLLLNFSSLHGVISKADKSVRGSVEGYVMVLEKGPRTQRYDKGIYHH